MTSSWIKTLARKVIFQYRRATQGSGPLPDFLIIGAQKSGTSSLYAYFSQHPQILPPYRKEIHFFDGGLNSKIDNFNKGQGWYRSHFPIGANSSTNLKTFEASPLYIFNPLTPRRIFDLVPKIKLIAILRNPSERAISHYFHEKRIGHESLPIMEALKQEDKRLESVIKDKDYKNDNFIHHSYKSRGHYKQQLERFLRYFPRQQILVLSSEDLFCEPDNTLEKVFKFIGVDTGFKVKDLKPRGVAKNKRKVNPEVYRYLNNYFQPYNQALYELIRERYRW